MRRALPIAAVLLAGQIDAGSADTALRPPEPSWATDARLCAWRWVEGGGIGFWAETCALGPGVWDIAWDAETGAFWERLDGAPQTRVVETWPLDPNREIGQLIAVLQAAGAPPQASDCLFRPADVAEEPATVARYRLTPAGGWPLVAPAGSAVPDDPCGPYGVSAGAVRYFVIDPRWPNRAVFVDAGQERPMFAPGSIVAAP